MIISHIEYVNNVIWGGWQDIPRYRTIRNSRKTMTEASEAISRKRYAANAFLGSISNSNSILSFHYHGFLLGWIILALLSPPCYGLLPLCFSTHGRHDGANRIRHRRCSLTMIHSIKIRIVGKKNSGETWLHDTYTCYETWLRGMIAVETVWHKNDADLVSSVMADYKKQHAVILLDPRGNTYSSEKFSHQFFSWLDAGGSRATFVIGGADGLPPELNPNSTMSKDTHFPSVSLSTLTMTHQFCRILLIEQIYRAAEICKGMLYLLPCLCTSSICCHLSLLFLLFFFFFL